MTLQSNILDYLKTVPKCWIVKVMTANMRGCPDILVCWKGDFLAIEVKEGEDRVAPIQDAQLQLIRRAEGRAYVARSMADVKKIFREKGRAYYVEENSIT